MKKCTNIFVYTLALVLFFYNVTYSQEISLTSLSQLEDPTNSGQVFLLNQNFNLQGKILNIAPGITLKPGGGIFINGFIGNVNFDIIDKKNKVFDESITFTKHYTKPFLVEWFGARGDGTTDDSRAIEKTILSANNIQLRRYRNYFLKNPVDVDRKGSITIKGNGAKITGNGFKLDPMLRFGRSFTRVNVSDFELDGEDKNAKGIDINGGLIAKKLYIHNFFAPLKTAYGIGIAIENYYRDSNTYITRKNVQIQIKECVIEHIKAVKVGQVNTADGIARAIQLQWFGTFENSSAEIRGNTLTNVVGDDGDVIQIAQLRNDYNGTVDENRTVIHFNTIAFATRRLIKASASNIEIYRNTFETFPADHPDNPALDKKTYMIAFQPFGGQNGKDQDFVLGSRFENNTFINDSLTFHGNGGTIGLQQTKGAIIRSNKFTNSKIVFDKVNQEVLFSKNTLTNSNISFARNAVSYNNFRISNNNGQFDSRAIARGQKPRSVILFSRNNSIEDITIADNRFSVFDPLVANHEITFVRIDNGPTAIGLKLLNNTLDKSAFGESTKAPIFIGSGVALDQISEIKNNKVIASVDKPDLGLRFIKVPPPFEFSYVNNKLDLPDTSDANDPIMLPSTNYVRAAKTFLIEENMENTIELAQNPVGDFIILKSKSKDLVQYTIHNSIGQVLLSGIEKGNEYRITTASLSPGAYLISLNSGSIKATKRFVKQ